MNRLLYLLRHISIKPPLWKASFSKAAHLSGYAIALAYVFGFVLLSIRQHASFHTWGYDLGYFDQVVWNTAHGRLFQNTMKTPNFLGDHFSPILGLVAPLYWIWADVRVLLILQTVALAAAVLPAFWLARKRNLWVAPLVVAAFYLHPSLHWVNLSEFHTISLAAPLIALAAYGLVVRRYRLSLLSLLIALLVQEDIAILVFLFGAYLVFSHSTRRLGVFLCALGLVWAAVVPFVVIPRFAGAQGFSHLSRWSYLGSTPTEALHILLSRPVVVWQHLIGPERLESLLRVLAPTAFLPLLGYDIFWLSLPVFGYLLASDFSPQYTLSGWNTTSILPILFIATVVGLSRLPRRGQYLAAVTLLLASLFCFHAQGLERLAGAARKASPTLTKHAQALFERIPPEASVSAQDDLVPHLSHRQDIRVFPSYGGAEFVALHRGGAIYPLSDLRAYEKAAQEILSNPSYGILYDGDGFVLARANQSANIEGPPLATFGGKIALRRLEIATMDADGVYQEQELRTLTLVPGQKVRVTLYWQALASIDIDYSVFIHFVTQDNQRIGQHDGMPANDCRVTSSWQPGEIVRDINYVQVASPAMAEGGKIMLGMYQWQTEERLETAGADNCYEAAQFRLASH